MKILDYEERGNRMVYTTDYAPMPIFVYPIDKFKNARSLRKEILKKIAEHEKQTTRRTDRKTVLVNELDKIRVMTGLPPKR
jgi:hypothetical protein